MDPNDIRSAYSINGLLAIPPPANSHSVSAHSMQQPSPLEVSAFNPMYSYSKPSPHLQTAPSVPIYSHQAIGQGIILQNAKILYTLYNVRRKSY